MKLDIFPIEQARRQLSRTRYDTRARAYLTTPSARSLLFISLRQVISVPLSLPAFSTVHDGLRRHLLRQPERTFLPRHKRSNLKEERRNFSQSNLYVDQQFRGNILSR